MLSACDQAVTYQAKAIADQQQVIANLKSASVLERDELSKEKEPHWYKNPIVLIGIGIVGGIVIKSQVK